MEKRSSQILNFSAIAVSFAVVVSGVYEFFYFLGFGTQLSETPLTTIDFLRGWMEWSSTGKYFFLGLCVHLLISRIESWKSEEEIVNATSNPARTRQIRDAPFRAIAWLSALLLLVFLVVGEIYYMPAMLGMLIASIALVLWIAKGSPLGPAMASSKWMNLWVILIFCAFNAFHLGTDASLANSSNRLTTVIQDSKTEVKVVRVFDQWSLVDLNDGVFAWYYHQSERIIKFSPDRRQFIGAYCYFWQEFDASKPSFCSAYRHLSVPATTKVSDETVPTPE